MSEQKFYLKDKVLVVNVSGTIHQNSDHINKCVGKVFEVDSIRWSSLHNRYVYRLTINMEYTSWWFFDDNIEMFHSVLNGKSIMEKIYGIKRI